MAQNPPGWRHLALPLAVFLVVAVASLAASTAIWRTAVSRDSDRLNAEARLAAAAATDLIGTHTAILRGAAGLFPASDTVGLDEFETYVGRLGIGTRYPGILGVGYTERAVGEAARAALVERMRREGFPDFRIWPAYKRDVYYAILFLSPLERRNRTAIGYDMFTEATRRAAMERARDSGGSTASSRVRLVQEIDPIKQPGFLIYTPVYRSRTIPRTVEERRRLLKGFAYSPLRAYDLFGTVFRREGDRPIDVAIYAGAPGPETLMFRTGEPDVTGPRVVVPIDVAQRRWTMIVTPTPLFEADSNVEDAWWVAAIGLLVALLLALATASAERARRALHAANLGLERRVEERTAALTDEMARREAAEDQIRQMQKMEAVGQLTGGIAHDFNNMLAVIIGNLDIAKRRRDDPGRLERLLDHALEGATRAATLTQRLLAFSRRQPLAPQPLDLNQTVAGMSELLRRTIGEPIRLQAHLADDLWCAFLDRAQLESAVLNLAVNGRDAMPQGGTLTIETANCPLDERYAEIHPGSAAGDYVLVSVSDTGEGMPAEVRERAFDPFFTTKEVGKGTGLGLSQVFGFVKQSGGHVEIYSEIGHGTCVKLYFPRLDGAGERPASGESAARPSPAGSRQEVVLVVEDEERVRSMSSDALRDLGYTVLEAAEATEALALLEANPQVTLLFTDIVMPGMNGRELADEALRRWPGLRLLFTTGYTHNAVVTNGLVDPAVSLLPKPFTVGQLAAKVRAVLDA